MKKTRVDIIDCCQRIPGITGVYVIRSGKSIGLIDTGAKPAFKHLAAGFERLGVVPGAITHIFVTHAHIDHCGCLHDLSNYCGNATVYCHPAAEIHMVYPKFLAKSTKEVFGEAYFAEHFESIESVSRQRITVLEDQQVLKFGNTEFVVHFRRGHCNHHYCIRDIGDNILFSGDCFGAQFDYLKSDKRSSFTLPLTPPNQFDLQASLDTIDWIKDLGVRSVYPTHFDELIGISRSYDQMKEIYGMADRVVREEGRDNELYEVYSAHVYSKLRDMSIPLTLRAQSLLNHEIRINVAGILQYYQKIGRNVVRI